MCDVSWLLVLAPVLGLTLDCLTHVAVCRMSSLRNQYQALTAAFLAGLAGPTIATIAAMRLMNAALADTAAMLALNVLTYLALAFGYFNFVNVSIASLRIRMLAELRDAGGPLPRERLLADYNSEHVLALRLARLTRGGHLLEKDGRFYQGPAIKFLLLARVFDLLRWIVLGSRRQPQPRACAD